MRGHVSLVLFNRLKVRKDCSDAEDNLEEKHRVRKFEAAHFLIRKMVVVLVMHRPLNLDSRHPSGVVRELFLEISITVHHNHVVQVGSRLAVLSEP